MIAGHLRELDGDRAPAAVHHVRHGARADQPEPDEEPGILGQLDSQEDASP